MSALTDFAIFKTLMFARSVNNDQFTGSTTGTGTANAVSQQCTRERGVAGANLSATTENGGPAVPFTAVFKTAKLLTTLGNAVANATDYGVVALNKRTGNGAAVVVATCNTSNVTITKFQPVSFTACTNGSNLSFAAGDVLTVSVTNTGNGAANNLAYIVDVTFEDV